MLRLLKTLSFFLVAERDPHGPDLLSLWRENSSFSSTSWLMMGEHLSKRRSLKNIMIQDVINLENCKSTTESTTQTSPRNIHVCGLTEGTGTVGLTTLLGALGTVGLLAIGWYGCLSCSIAELILAVLHGDWWGTLRLVVGLLCSGEPGWAAILGCGLFLVWAGESQTKSRKSLYFFFIRA